MAVVAPVVAAMPTLAVYPAWAPRMRPIVMGLPTYQTTASGLRFLDEQLGCSDGAVAAPGQAVRVQYSFRLLSSNAARTTWDIGASLALGSDRCGFWDEALAGMREAHGSAARFLSAWAPRRFACMRRALTAARMCWSARPSW